MLRIAAACLFALATIGFVAPSADAYPKFKKAFGDLYITDDTDADYKKLVKKANCNVCHQGKNKKNRNPYGEALSPHITKEDSKDLEKLTEALKKVEEEHSVADDEESPTWKQLIEDNKLPGGTLEEVKKEPEDSEGSEE